MAKYRARFEVMRHNYYMDGSVLESEDLATIWRYAYSHMRQFMYEIEGEDSTMFIYFEKEIPSLSSLTDDSFWAHITTIAGFIHLDHLAALDKISGLGHNNRDVYAIRRREA